MLAHRFLLLLAALPIALAGCVADAAPEEGGAIDDSRLDLPPSAQHSHDHPEMRVPLAELPPGTWSVRIYRPIELANGSATVESGGAVTDDYAGTPAYEKGERFDHYVRDDGCMISVEKRAGRRLLSPTDWMPIDSTGLDSDPNGRAQVRLATNPAGIRMLHCDAKYRSLDDVRGAFNSARTGWRIAFIRNSELPPPSATPAAGPRDLFGDLHAMDPGVEGSLVFRGRIPGIDRRPCELRFRVSSGLEERPYPYGGIDRPYGAYLVQAKGAPRMGGDDPQFTLAEGRPSAITDQHRWSVRRESTSTWFEGSAWVDAADGSLSAVQTRWTEITDPIRDLFAEAITVHTLYLALDASRTNVVSYRATKSDDGTQTDVMDCVDMARVAAP